MNVLEWALQAGLVVCLLAALPLALRLERALSALRRDRAALAASVQGFAEATKEAEAVITRLRAAADSTGHGLSKQVTVAGTVREDLRFLSERAEGIANRLDAAIRTSRSLASAQIAGEPGRPVLVATTPRPRVEQELKWALDRMTAHGTDQGRAG